MVLNNNFHCLSPLKLNKSVKTITKNWKQKSPLQKWIYVYSIGKALFKVGKLPLYERNQTLSWSSYFVWSYVILYGIIVMNTFIYYTSHGEFQKSLSCTCMMGPIVTCMPMVIQLTSKNRHTIQSMLNFAGHHFYRNEHENTEYNRICSDQMNFTARTLMVKTILMFTGGFATQIGPFYVFIAHGIRTTTADLKFPFIEENSPYQFYLNCALQLVFLGHGLFIFNGIEITVTILENAIRAAPKLIQYELIQSINEYQQNAISKTEFRFSFRNTIIQCLDVLSFSKSVKNLLYWRTFSMIPIFCYSIGMSIYGQLTMDFAADILYGVEWIDIPCDVQKDVITLIHQTQNGVKLTVGPFATVNRQLFQVATNKIYSFLMFLLNFST